MESATFALPTLGSTGMSRDDQTLLLLNQATAVIVSAWLGHKNVLIQSDKFINSTATFISPDTLAAQIVSEAELVSVINSVQTALRAV